MHPETTIHELFHAYVWEVCVPSADLTADQMEEVAADILAKYGKRIWKQADEIDLAYRILKGRVTQ